MARGTLVGSMGSETVRVLSGVVSAHGQAHVRAVAGVSPPSVRANRRVAAPTLGGRSYGAGPTRAAAAGAPTRMAAEGGIRARVRVAISAKAEAQDVGRTARVDILALRRSRPSRSPSGPSSSKMRVLCSIHAIA